MRPDQYRTGHLTASLADMILVREADALQLSCWSEKMICPERH